MVQWEFSINVDVFHRIDKGKKSEKNYIGTMWYFEIGDARNMELFCKNHLEISLY